MPREYDFFVYVLSKATRPVLYIGVTSELEGRLYEHHSGTHPKSFTARYLADRLVY